MPAWTNATPLASPRGLRSEPYWPQLPPCCSSSSWAVPSLQSVRAYHHGLVMGGAVTTGPTMVVGGAGDVTEGGDVVAHGQLRLRQAWGW